MHRDAIHPLSLTLTVLCGCPILGKLDLELSPFSISEAVHKVNAALRGALLQKQVRLVSSPSFSLGSGRSASLNKLLCVCVCLCVCVESSRR